MFMSCRIHHLVLDDIVTSTEGDALPFAWQHIPHLARGIPDPISDHSLSQYQKSLLRIHSGSIKMFVAKAGITNGT